MNWLETDKQISMIGMDLTNWMRIRFDLEIN